MKNNVKTFEEFSGNTRKVNLSDLGNSWSANKHVNKGMGKHPYVICDKRISDIEDQVEVLKQKLKDGENDETIKRKLYDEMYKLAKQIPILRKDKKNSIKLWVYKENPSSSDRELYMTDEQAKELNDYLIAYRKERDRYHELVDKYKSPTTTNPDFHRPKGEL